MCALFGGLSPLGFQSAQAAAGSWSGASSALWQLNANWSGASFPTAGEAATFNGAGNGNTTIDIGTGLAVGSIIFDTSSAAGYTIGTGAVNSQTFTLSNSGALTMNSTVANNQLFNAAIILGADKTLSTYTITNSSTTNSLTLAGTLTGNNVTGTAGIKTLAVAGAGNTTISGAITAGGATNIALTKTGAGKLTLSSASNAIAGNVTISGGSVDISGTLGTNTTNGNFRVGTVASTAAVLNILTGAVLNNRFNLFVGDAGSGTGGGAVYQNGGSLTLTQAAGIDNLRIGSNGSGYGYYKLSGGTLTSARPAIGASLADTVGVVDVTGGTFTSTEQTHIAGGSASSSGLLNVTGGTVNAGTDIRMLSLQAGTAGATQLAVLNVGGGAGAASVTTGNSATQGLNLAQTGNVAGELSVVNLLTNGTLTTGRVLGTQVNATTHFNFNGGTLKATAINNGAIFGDATLDAVNVYSGGGTINNNGTAITINRGLLAPTGAGVSNSSVSVPSGGAGYIGAPLVKLTGGTGTGATGYAVLTNGVVTSIVITSPGIGYTLGDTLTATFFGGGAATAATTITGITVAANTSGGMTFQGTGTTTLSGANTYTGATTVSAGTLGVTGSLTSSISVGNGATLSGTGTTTGSLTMNSGSALSVDPVTEFTANGVNFAGSTSLLFSSALTSGNTYDVVTYGAGGLTNLGNLVQSTRGTLANDVGNLKVTFTAGAILTDTWNTVNGTWNVGAAANWSNGSDGLFYNSDTAVFDDTPGADSIASISGTVIPATVTVSGVTNHTINGSGAIAGTGTLTKSGSGTLNVQTVNTYSGGTTVNGGTLVVSNSGTLGSGAITISSGTLQVGDGTTDGTIASASSIANSGSLVYNLVGNQSYANAITGPGTLTKSGAGTLTLSSGTSSYSGGTTISGGGINISASTALGTGAVSIGSGTILTATAGVTLANTFTGSGAYVGSVGQTVINGNWTGFSGTFSNAAGADTSFLNSATAGIFNGTSATAAYVNNYTGNNTNGFIVANTSGGAITAKMGSYSSVALSNLRNSGGSTSAVTYEIGNLNTDTTVAGGIGGIGATAQGGSAVALTKVGTGNMTLSGATGNGYTGGTTVSGGKLTITNTSNSATGSGAVALSGGTTTTLSGTGIATGAVTVTNGSRLAPGVNTTGTNTNFGVAGTLTLSGALTLTSANMDFDLSSAAATGNDRISTAGALTLSSSISFTFNSLNGSFETGTPYTLISGASGVSGFDATALASNTFYSGLAGNSYSAVYSMSGNDLQVSFTAIPEPHQWGIILGGMLAVMAIVRRRKMAGM